VDITALAPGSDIYISACILSSGAEGHSWRYHRLGWKNQHAIWEHGNKLISQPSPTQQDLEAAVMQFQRAVEHRDKLLDQIYGFESIPGKRSDTKYAIMADLGIIRPTLKIRLREIRNSLIHQPQESALTASECDLLSDTVWYYLKVTDRITQQCSDELWLDHRNTSDKSASLEVVFQTVRWSAHVKGDVHPEMLLEKPSKDCLSVRLKQCEAVRYNGHLKFYGETTGSDSAMYRLIQMFFNESVA
jgi:hypothetical protein